MSEIPEHLLLRSAEAKAKALGVPVEQVLAEMRGEAPPAPAAAPVVQPVEAAPEESAPVAEAPVEPVVETPPIDEVAEEVVEVVEEVAVPEVAEVPAKEPVAVAAASTGTDGPALATSVTPRPVAAPESAPEGVRTQRLLTVVKARAIQQVKAEPTDKVSTWPHLMIAEFAAILAVTGFVILLSVILQAPLLEAANFNATPNPSKAPWYFLGLQELLSYFDPQIAGVTVPTIVGLVGFMAIPYVDRNPSNKPTDRKFAIFMYTFFIMGSGTLSIIGVLFRGKGFNWAYPWVDGIFFDDIKDWVHFE